LRQVSFIAPKSCSVVSFIAPSVNYCADVIYCAKCHLLRLTSCSAVSFIAPISFIAPRVIYCAERLVPRCQEQKMTYAGSKK
jgi:hypothetical protein